MNYEEDIRIDETALDVEWLEQPRLMIKYARNSAEASRRVEIAKARLDLVRAELDRDIRTVPTKYEIEKVVEAVVTNTILMQPKYQEKEAELIDARYEYEIARNAVYAINARKDALENLVKLHGMQYFAGPRIPRDLSKEYQNRASQKQVDSGIALKMKRK